MSDDDIKKIEESIGYVFNDKKLLTDAFTHSSYTNENRAAVSYERLEYLGDSILGFIVAENLYFRLNKDEGAMTELRAEIVSKGPLSAAVDAMGIVRYLRIGRGAKNDVVGSQKAKSDLFESLLAAIYIDSGRHMDKPRDFVKRNLNIGYNAVNYKSRFQEYTQKYMNGAQPKYFDIEKSDNKPPFRVNVTVDGKIYGSGEGHSKQKAQQQAAAAALRALGLLS